MSEVPYPTDIQSTTEVSGWGHLKVYSLRAGTAISNETVQLDYCLRHHTLQNRGFCMSYLILVRQSSLCRFHHQQIALDGSCETNMHQVR